MTDGTSLFHQAPFILEVPSRLEVLTLNQAWQQHPVVFLHNLHTQGDIQQMIVFLKDGKYAAFPYKPFSSKEHNIYLQAQKRGLTAGSRAGILALVKDEE